MDYPLWINANFAIFVNRYFYSLEMLVFYLESHQTPFLAYLSEKEGIKKFYNFGQKEVIKKFLN